MTDAEITANLESMTASRINWTTLSMAVLGRQGRRIEVVGRIAEGMSGLLRENERLRAELASTYMIAAGMGCDRCATGVPRVGSGPYAPDSIEPQVECGKRGRAESRSAESV